MKKSQFVKIIKKFQELEENISGIDAALKKLSPDFGGFYIDTASDLIMEVLEIAMDDTNEWISYWIYELDWGKNAKNDTVGNNIPIKTLENLYDLIRSIAVDNIA